MTANQRIAYRAAMAHVADARKALAAMRHARNPQGAEEEALVARTALLEAVKALLDVT